MIQIASGYGFADENFSRMPERSYRLLQKVAEDFQLGETKVIIAAGGWSINYDLAGIVPTHTEAELMADYLIDILHIPQENVLREERSRDTIGNAYFCKGIIKKLGCMHVRIYCADYHEERLRWIYKKIFGPEYSIEICTVETGKMQDSAFIEAQHYAFERQKEFLKSMTEGDDAWLEKRLYNDPYYQSKRPEKLATIAMGKE